MSHARLRPPRAGVDCLVRAILALLLVTAPLSAQVTSPARPATSGQALLGQIQSTIVQRRLEHQVLTTNARYTPQNAVITNPAPRIIIRPAR